MEERAHMLCSAVQEESKKWKTVVWKMEEALRSSNVSKISASAKQLLAMEGVDYNTPKEAYHQLLHMMEEKGSKERSSGGPNKAQISRNGGARISRPTPKDSGGQIVQSKSS